MLARFLEVLNEKYKNKTHYLYFKNTRIFCETSEKSHENHLRILYLLHP